MVPLHCILFTIKTKNESNHLIISSLSFVSSVKYEKLLRRTKVSKRKKKKTLKSMNMPQVRTPEELVFQESYRKLNNDVVVRNMNVLLRFPTLLNKGNKVDACRSTSITWQVYVQVSGHYSAHIPVLCFHFIVNQKLSF